jgi:hypothetical protein
MMYFEIINKEILQYTLTVPKGYVICNIVMFVWRDTLVRIQSLLKPTVTVYNYLSFVLPISDCHHRGDPGKIR